MMLKTINHILIAYLFLMSYANSTENFYDLDYSKKDLINIDRAWIYNSGVLKDTQNKIIQYKEKIVHLDGNKNLIVLLLNSGKQVCKSNGKKDRAPFRGVSLYKSNKKISD